MNLIDWAERGLLPDAVVRAGIRRLLGKRLRGIAADPSAKQAELASFCQQLRSGPLAVATNEANEQHYEVPAEFFERVLGPRLKYSCCYFHRPGSTLAEAEEEMLRRTCERADIREGMRVLELGCGWGSLTLWMAEQFPGCEITAISNSHGQRRFIQQRAAAAGIENLTVRTLDMREADFPSQFDRVVSVEMFEHMRNYELLLERISHWLAPGGKLLAHIFVHRDTPYLFETEGDDNWMGRHFFTGGTMPSADLLGQFPDHLTIEKQWRVVGLHYWRTSEQWLRNLDRHGGEIVRRFRQDMPRRDAQRAVQRWRMFFMACAELFRYRGGDEWFVAHYLFRHAETPAREPAPAGVAAAR